MSNGVLLAVFFPLTFQTAVLVALGNGVPLIVLMLPAHECDLYLGPLAFDVHLQGHQRVALFLGNAETTLCLESCFQRVPYNLAGCYRKIEPGM